MFAITGITGQVGGRTAESLLASGLPVRAIVRAAGKAEPWRARGCEAAVAEMTDAAALTAAFRDVQGVFVLLPPLFDPSPGFPEVRRITAALRTALETARPPRVVCLSTVGAQATEENLLTQLSIMERELETTPGSVSFLRAAWFMENAVWDTPAARERGLIASFLQPLDKPFPMVSVADVGRVAAEMLRQASGAPRVVELEGPRRTSPRDVAARFARLLGRPVQAEAVPRESWRERFLAQGMKNPAPRMCMLDGFNEGWIEFAGGEAGSLKGTVSLDEALAAVLAGSRLPPFEQSR